MNNNMQALAPKRCSKCNRLHYGNGLCRHHYEMAIRAGRPRSRPSPKDVSRLEGGANWEPVLNDKKMSAYLQEKKLLNDFKAELEKKLRALNLKK